MDLAFLHADVRHDTEITVVDVLVVIVLDLHDLVAGTECPAKAYNAGLAWRVQYLLKLNVQRAGTEATAVHRTKHLNVAYCVQPKTLRDPVLHDRQYLPDTL